jgi:hypothetical protein
MGRTKEWIILGLVMIYVVSVVEIL